MRKAQVTLFIIIGIVLVISIGLMIYLFAGAAEKETEQQVSVQRLRQTAVKSVNDYITSCLDVTASQALALVGKQGGRLYNTQGSLFTEPVVGEGQTYLVYDDHKIIYGIKPPDGTVGNIFFSSPPKYPWDKFPYIPGGTQDYGYFGISDLPPLYKDISGEMSIQEQLEKYIITNVLECTDWASFEAQGLSINAGTPEVSMIIAENLTQLQYEEYISFILNWDVKVKEHSTQAQAILDEFAVSYPIRFGKIYYAIKEIVDQEVTNISYEPETTASHQIMFAKDVKNKDDVIIYKDMQAKLKGLPYEFRIARKNRPPALHWVNQTELDTFGYCVGNNIVFSGNEFTFSPPCSKDHLTGDFGGLPPFFPLMFIASDPDADTITYSIDPSSIDLDPDWINAMTQYSINSTTNGLKITVTASDGEFQDSQVLRFIPVAQPPE